MLAPPWVIAHGVLLGLAWLACVPMGIFCALPVGRQLFGPKWLTMHALCVNAAVVLTIVGSIVAIAQKRVEGHGRHVTAHTVIGFMVLGLSILQLFGGMLRPASQINADDAEKATAKSKSAEDDESALRSAWAFGHKNGGKLLFLTALAAVGLGINSSLHPFHVHHH